MAENEEPQFTSLQARIAALNQSQSAQHQTFGKRAPPPIPTAGNRPTLQSRGQTINNPPIATYGPSSTKQANNQPLGVKGGLLPPPPVERDNLRSASPGKSPPLPTRNVPPPLPGRKGSQPSPALPPRKTSTTIARRGSNSSTLSVSSTLSGISLGQVSTATSASSIGEGRKLPPPLESAKLPPLPPSKREREEAGKNARAERATMNGTMVKAPLVTVKSTPNLIREPPVVERDLMPKLPSRPSLPRRPSGPPQIPSRTINSSNSGESIEPAQPTRKLPPPAASTRNILSMGFNSKDKAKSEAAIPPPVPATRPISFSSRSTGSVVQELTDRNFDNVIMAGTPALVDFYAPYCKYCKELDPIWQQLGEKFASSSDRVIIAKMDVDAYKSFKERFSIEGYPTIYYFDGRTETPEAYPWSRDLEWLIRFLEERTGAPAADTAVAPVPPPINLNSKPAISQVKALISRPAPAPALTSGCLICRDFSRPDQIASQYPRESLPRGGDLTAYLADVLCGSFNSYTDKARAIFTWLHHNIAYDTGAFFSNNVKHVSPADVITTGLAVCGGYAGLFVAIALKAGMECVMVTGHGKGYGYSPLKPEEPVPPCNPAGHAWNAVRIDGGDWKLLDACWGAGNVGNQVYNKSFKPSYFTMSNDDFGIKHFPKDSEYFFRSDGRVQTWEEYMIGPVGAEPLQIYGSVGDHGLSETSFSPAQKHLSVYSNEVIRFQFSLACEHWNHSRNGKGKPYQMVLKIHGVDGRKDDYVAFENNEFWYWADVHSTDLGAPGQTVSVYAVTTVNGQDARGMTRREYLIKKGKAGMGFGGVCAWELV